MTLSIHIGEINVVCMVCIKFRYFFPAVLWQKLQKFNDAFPLLSFEMKNLDKEDIWQQKKTDGLRKCDIISYAFAPEQRDVFRSTFFPKKGYFLTTSYNRKEILDSYR